jgi:dolichyl-phosphate-mannose--protein O-mannosyl transferase
MAPSSTLPSHPPSGRLLPAVLLGLGLLLHLPGLGAPHQVVFDEVHYGKYVTAYCCSGERLFDVHPPHAKLLLAGSAWALGYRGGFDFKDVGESYGTVPVLALRLLPNLVGALLPLLGFLLLAELGVSRAAAFLGGAALAFDNALLVHSRYLLLDGLLVAAVLGALAAYLRARRATSRGGRVGWHLAAGGLAGLAAGVKVTGLVALGMMLLALAVGAVWRRAPGERVLSSAVRATGWGAVLLVSALAVYAAGWAAHFRLLDRPGIADSYSRTTGHFAADLVNANRAMLSVNLRLRAKHPNISPWWGWPWLRSPVPYWRDGLRELCLFGNPVVWWGSSLLLLALGGQAALAAAGRCRAVAPAALFAAAAWLFSYLPLAGVARPLFLYHYLPSLALAVVAAACWLDGTGWIRPGGPRAQGTGYRVALGLIAVGFVIVSPLSWGFVAPAGLQGWLLSWVRSF